MRISNFNPHFDVRPSLITGDTADLYLHRTQRVLRNEGLNPPVVMDFAPSYPGTLCGTMEVKAILSKVAPEGARELWAVEEGDEVDVGEVCLSIRAAYSPFGLYETAICGVLASSTGWATVAKECVQEARGVPIVCVGAHSVHPSVAPVMDYAAVVGGCFTGSTVLGAKLAGTPPTSTVSGALIQIMGSANKAIEAFDRSVAPEVPRIAYVDPRGDVVAQTMEIAHLMKERLNAVRIARIPGARLVTAEIIKEVRKRLDEADYRHVEIVVSGEMSPARIKRLLDDSAPVDVFHDTGYIAAAKPIGFRANIRTISDKPVPQEQEPLPHNPRLVRLL
jgi:nicotinate phosphoribosyltransferase